MNLASSSVQEQWLVSAAILRPLVPRLLLLSTALAAAPSRHTLLPSFQATLLLNLGADAELWWPRTPAQRYHLNSGRALLLGPLTTALHYCLPAAARVLVLPFSLAGFYQVFQVSAGSLRNAVLDPTLVLPPAEIADLLAELVLCTSSTDLQTVVTAWCARRQHPLATPHAALLAGLPQLSQPAVIQQLAVASHCTPRTLQLRFQHYLGFSAQQAQRFRRFRGLLSHLRGRLAGDGAIDWFAALTQHGYYDQSHLIRDFQYFLHQSPRQLRADLQQGASLCLPDTAL